MHQRLISKVDNSVNWVIKHRKSNIECRYVRRSPKYISAYLSSHNGCKMACKFCWLTDMKQNNFDHVNIDDYKSQLEIILQHSKQVDKDKSKNVRVNVNLMARGEALANKYIVNDYKGFYNGLDDIVKKYDYNEMKINISTIMPYTILDKHLIDIFSDLPANLYYSIYSVNSEFRKKWMPNAIPHNIALDKLKKYQDKTNNPITFHFALINGENDDMNDIKKLADTINQYDFTKTKVNIVRFNPPPSLTNYSETSYGKIEQAFNILSSIMKDDKIVTNKSRIIPRVGRDVKASCGMFINDENI